MLYKIALAIVLILAGGIGALFLFIWLMGKVGGHE